MITWIICLLLFAWCIYKRTRPDGKVEGYPLGMPRGTVRAVIAILIVSFPLQYMVFNLNIPGLIVNALFIVVAFYFEARKPSEDRLRRIIKEIKNPEKYAEEKKKQKLPLYLPKYSVRIILVLLLSIIILVSVVQDTQLQTTNTIIDIVLIIALYMFGSILRGIGVSRERKKIKEQIVNIQDHDKLSKYAIIEKFMDEKDSWWERKGRTFLSMVMLVSVIVSLFLYTIFLDFLLIDTAAYSLSIQGLLLLLINVYYGIRD